jgi:cell division protein FtsX
VVDDIKRFNHLRPLNASYVQMRLDSTNLRYAEITLRSRADIPDAVFRERFVKEMENALQIGNFYLKDITSIEQIGVETDIKTGQTNSVRTRLWLMLFFLLNILLCVLGTFRYRIQTRRHEIGLRKALGASKASINRQFLAEGLCLLAVAAMVAVVINANIFHAGLIETPGADATLPAVYLPDRTGLRFLITNALTVLMLALVIVSAIWLPARRAAALPSAEALRDE